MENLRGLVPKCMRGDGYDGFSDLIFYEFKISLLKNISIKKYVGKTVIIRHRKYANPRTEEPSQSLNDDPWYV
jgi:hypothetical protein